MKKNNSKIFWGETDASLRGTVAGAVVGVIMGSDSDLKVMEEAAKVLEEFGIVCELTIVSAHRTPDRMREYALTAVERGLKVIIAGAGGAAHLPGMIASYTPLPVIGVPIKSSNSLIGLDSLLSISQMPAGIPVATVAIDGAKNAGLLAVRILALVPGDGGTLARKYTSYQKNLEAKVALMVEDVAENRKSLKLSGRSRLKKPVLSTDLKRRKKI